MRLTLPSSLLTYSLDPNESFHTQKVCLNSINDPFFDEKPIFHVLLPHTVEARHRQNSPFSHILTTFTKEGWCKIYHRSHIRKYSQLYMDSNH